MVRITRGVNDLEYGKDHHAQIHVHVYHFKQVNKVDCLTHLVLLHGLYWYFTCMYMYVYCMNLCDEHSYTPSMTDMYLTCADLVSNWYQWDCHTHTHTHTHT